MLVTLITVLCLALANAVDQAGTDLYPYCDLVSVSYVRVEKHDDLVDIHMSWDRKAENYEQINGNLTEYVVRHGPLENDQPVANQTVIMRVPVIEDEFILANVTPTDDYFVQICAVGSSYRFLFQPDLWDHAWRGWMGLGIYKTKPDTVQDSQFAPQCDLVQTSYVLVDDQDEAKPLSIQYIWAKKESSYRNVKTLDAYFVRHGPVSDGMIQEDLAQYTNVGRDTFFMLDSIARGGIYGLQICAIDSNRTNFDVAGIDWDKEAWLGTLNLTLPGQMVSNWTEVPDGFAPIESRVDSPEELVNETDIISIVPRCDLLQHSHISVAKNPDSDTLTLSYTWKKKQDSYETIGVFHHYLVRHGPWKVDVGMPESSVRYAIVPSDADQVVLDDVPTGGEYGIQMCAVVSDDPARGLDNSFDWTNKAWVNNVDLPMNEEQWFNYDGTIELASPPTSNQLDAQDDDNDSEEVIMGADEPILMSKVQLANNYGILILVIAVIGVISITIGCVWLIVARKRRNAKLAAFTNELPTKVGLELP